MNKLETLKKLASLRKDPVFEFLGVLPESLRNTLIQCAKSADNAIVENLDDRYSNAVDPELFQSHHEHIRNSYIQTLVPDHIKIEIEDILGIKIYKLKVAIMRPGFGLDWHLDFDTKHRFHCDLNLSSNFIFRIKDKELPLLKEVGEVYKINTSHYHKVFNLSDKERYSLIGVLY